MGTVTTMITHATIVTNTNIDNGQHNRGLRREHASRLSKFFSFFFSSQFSLTITITVYTDSMNENGDNNDYTCHHRHQHQHRQWPTQQRVKK